MSRRPRVRKRKVRIVGEKCRERYAHWVGPSLRVRRRTALGKDAKVRGMA